jgi:hypothetical protein
MLSLYPMETTTPAPTVRNRRQPKLRCHKDVKTTMIFTHILGNSGGRGVTGPADTLHQPQVSP